jgi:hypothetical protein
MPFFRQKLGNNRQKYVVIITLTPGYMRLVFKNSWKTRWAPEQWVLRESWDTGSGPVRCWQGTASPQSEHSGKAKFCVRKPGTDFVISNILSPNNLRFYIKYYLKVHLTTNVDYVDANCVNFVKLASKSVFYMYVCSRKFFCQKHTRLLDVNWELTL